MHAGTYARWLIPSIFPHGILQCQIGFLQTQKFLNPLIISTSFRSLIHVLACWLLVFRFEFGNEGAALSIAISYWINVLIFSAYIKLSPSCKMTWNGFSREGLRNLFSSVSLAIPSALMVCLEMWSYEILVLMSGFLPNPKLETSMMSISRPVSSLNTSSVIFRIPYGFGSAVSTRVSNELGAGKHRAAQVAARVVLFLAVVEGLLVGLVSIAVRDVWGYLYTTKGEVVRYMSAIMPVLVLSNYMDGIQGVLSVAAALLLLAVLIVLAVRTTIVTWITVLVLLAFAGNRRRVLVKNGRRITLDVAMHLATVFTKERGIAAVAACVTVASLIAMASLRKLV
ncbi:hypothetical protein ACH5RR_025456 [Cinchona calisaya]|uniref:Uncharacterized protein n=1 Tax=Cinchona calisaya TaxID=153742 RepID=A0ABD2Z238_9GENT